MSEQCELCLGYSNDCKELVICEVCVDQAASYTITASERNDLRRAVINALDALKGENPSMAKGILEASLKLLVVQGVRT